MRRSVRSELSDSGFYQDFQARYGRYLLFGLVVIGMLAQLSISFWIATNLPHEQSRTMMSQAFSVMVALGALWLGLQQWLAARHETSMDKFYDRLDRASKRLDELNLCRIKPNPLPGKRETYELIACVYTELDNLEYAVEKYRLGYMKDEFAHRALKTFENRCQYPEFRRLVLEMVDNVGHTDRTANVVRLAIKRVETRTHETHVMYPPLVEILDLARDKP